MPLNKNKPIFKIRRDYRLRAAAKSEVHKKEKLRAEEKSIFVEKSARISNISLSFIGIFLGILTLLAMYFTWQNALDKQITTLEESEISKPIENISAQNQIETGSLEISRQINTINEMYKQVATQLKVAEQRLRYLENNPQSAVLSKFIFPWWIILFFFIVATITYIRPLWLIHSIIKLQSLIEYKNVSYRKFEIEEKASTFSRRISVFMAIIAFTSLFLPTMLGHYLNKDPQQPLVLILNADSSYLIPTPDNRYLLPSTGKEYKMVMSECVFDKGISSISVTAETTTANKKCFGLERSSSNLRDNLCKMAKNLEKHGFNELLVIGQHDSSKFSLESRKFNRNLAESRALSVKNLLEKKDICGLDVDFKISTVSSENWFKEPNQADRRVYMIGIKNIDDIL